ncbi:MAG: 50S ribosomal protein L2 [Patescibacteria group bacterium]
MAIKIYKPTTPARRKMSIVSSSDLTKKKREKSLTKGLPKKSGRNNSGRLTVRHRGGGARKIYRHVDFKRLRFDEVATVEAIEYDPNRNARIALVKYDDGSKSYILAFVGMKIGDKVISSLDKVEIKNGNRMPLELIPQGEMVYNVELEPQRGGVMARSAGTGVILQNVEGKYAQLKMPSSEIRLVNKACLASIGQVSNPEAKLIRIGKAGRKRHMGIKPTVRGKAMNPVDHPHGGGEGKHPIGLLSGPKNIYGKKALGIKTRGKKWSNKLIIKRRKRNRK